MRSLALTRQVVSLHNRPRFFTRSLLCISRILPQHCGLNTFPGSEQFDGTSLSKQCLISYKSVLLLKFNNHHPCRLITNKGNFTNDDEDNDDYHRYYSKTFEDHNQSSNSQEQQEENVLSKHPGYQAPQFPDGAKLSHVDSLGRASMVDVGPKQATSRSAKAVALVEVGQEAFRLIRDNVAKKGDVLTVAQVAGILAAKRTSELIPLCHPLFLSHVDVQCSLASEGDRDNVMGLKTGKTHVVIVTCQAKCQGQTGVEMEALVGASIAALTIYDMCKAVDKGIVLRDIRLLYKDGGKSWRPNDL